MTECTCHVHSPVNGHRIAYTEHTCRACGGTKPCQRCKSLRENTSSFHGFRVAGIYD